jgi:curli biogenesis system outer membrane secretion channel CsgG
VNIILGRYMTIVLLALGLACGPAPRTYLSDDITALKGYRVALLPLDNLSAVDGASTKIDEILLVELLHLGLFDVVDPGQVEKVLMELRIRRTSELTREEITALSEKINIRALITGSVLEYGSKESRSSGGASVPTVSVVLRMIEAASGRILWAASHSRTGDDAEKVFGVGRVRNQSKLSKTLIKDMLESMKSIDWSDE